MCSYLPSHLPPDFAFFGDVFLLHLCVSIETSESAVGPEMHSSKGEGTFHQHNSVEKMVVTDGVKQSRPTCPSTQRNFVLTLVPPAEDTWVFQAAKLNMIPCWPSLLNGLKSVPRANTLGCFGTKCERFFCFINKLLSRNMILRKYFFLKETLPLTLIQGAMSYILVTITTTKSQQSTICATPGLCDMWLS